jgi:hypothetical protein
MKHQKLDIVERTAISKMVEEPTRIVGVREARYVGTSPNRDRFAPPPPPMETTKGQ